VAKDSQPFPLDHLLSTSLGAPGNDNSDRIKLIFGVCGTSMIGSCKLETEIPLELSEQVLQAPESSKFWATLGPFGKPTSCE
jgi:hypothetical protein